jgi:hypothetical protein
MPPSRAGQLGDRELTVCNRLGLFLVAGSFAALDILAVADIRGVFEHSLLLTVLNTLFGGIIPVVVAYIAGRTYLKTGSAAGFVMGCGIDRPYQDGVFRLFDKLDQKTGGTGIGPAVAKRIVDVQGGRIRGESERDGKGSTFCFALPRAMRTRVGETETWT